MFFFSPASSSNKKKTTAKITPPPQSSKAEPEGQFRNDQYNCPEYYQHDRFSFFELIDRMADKRLPQKSNKEMYWLSDRNNKEKFDFFPFKLLKSFLFIKKYIFMHDAKISGIIKKKRIIKIL